MDSIFRAGRGQLQGVGWLFACHPFFAFRSSLLPASAFPPKTSHVKAIAIIPARLASTRLPRKALREIAGRPMLAWVYEAARACPQLQNVIVATDSDEIAAICRQNGWHYRMTSPEHRSGTDRVHEVALALDAEVYVNLQGDEPLARREHLDVLLELMQSDDVEVGTLKTPCAAEDVNNPNAVKVVTAADGRALYFSRATIPFDRDRSGAVRYYKHLGFYAYRKAALDRFCTWPESELERNERLEQLRFLANGVAIHVAETPYDTVGVDTEEELRRVEEILRRRS
jgi:3-deoxy-manno-octulosonate cytidylyltransferase (CMP-KDO synthetase)